MNKATTALLALTAALGLAFAPAWADDPSHEPHSSDHQHHHGDAYPGADQVEHAQHDRRQAACDDAV